jgi:hypothetical protein
MVFTDLNHCPTRVQKPVFSISAPSKPSRKSVLARPAASMQPRILSSDLHPFNEPALNAQTGVWSWILAFSRGEAFR